jgi:hypothetical protein
MMMNKRKKINRKILTGCLLLLLFALPPAVGTIHACQCVYFNDIEHDEQNSHAHHDCNTCAICQFVLSPFTEAELIEFDFAVKTIDSKQFTYWENINFLIIYNYMLRAPPCA